jgi:hypothetical protein
VLNGWIGTDLIGTADLTGKNLPGKLKKPPRWWREKQKRLAPDAKREFREGVRLFLENSTVC